MSKKDMQNSFALGLASKGVLTIDKTPILTDVVNKQDESVDLTDKDGNKITVIPTYDDKGAIISFNYNGTDIPVSYDADGNITAVGDTVTDIKEFNFQPNTLVDNTVTFMVDGKLYQSCSVKNGNAVSVPLKEDGSVLIPISNTGKRFLNWKCGNQVISNVFKPTQNMQILGNFTSVDETLERNEIGEVIAVNSEGIPLVTKKNKGTCICAKSHQVTSRYTWQYVYSISIDPLSAQCAEINESYSKSQYNYKGVTYYIDIYRDTTSVYAPTGKNLVDLGVTNDMDMNDMKMEQIFANYYRTLTCADSIYYYYGINKKEYPYLLILPSGSSQWLYFAQDYKFNFDGTRYRFNFEGLSRNDFITTDFKGEKGNVKDITVHVHSYGRPSVLSKPIKNDRGTFVEGAYLNFDFTEKSPVYDLNQLYK